MKYRLLGRSGLTVSRVCLGTMTFGAKEWGCDQETAHRLLDSFAAAGGNFIDTADIYAGGRSEEIVGAWLRGRPRDDFIVATKAFFRTGPSANARGLSRKHLFAAVEASLHRLQTDVIDLYYAHGNDLFTPLEETMAAFDDLVRSGKVRYLGVSNWPAWRFAKAGTLARAAGETPFVAAQYLYNLINREAEREVLPACAEEGLGLVPWSPLGGGLLAGNYARAEAPPSGSRAAHRREVDGPRFWHERGFQVAEALAAYAAETGLPPARLALGWLLKNRAVSSIIIGVRTAEQLAANLSVADVDLSDEQAARLAELSRFDLGYLAQFVANARRILHEPEF